MSGLLIDGVGKRFGAVDAVKDIHLQVPEGSFVCLLGPSGCGKTTLLRMIAGLEDPTSGRILLDNNDISAVPVHQRNFGMVFQSLALFPHLSVGENIQYPLKIRGQPVSVRQAREDELLAQVQLKGYGGRAVSELSGGQRQRVAIARALAVSPRVFLLDEPLSALDAKLREAMQIELRELQQRLGITTIVVTHDQREAMTMADLVVVMGEGQLRQVAPPVEIYRRPADTFVADFIGSTNLLPLQRSGNALVFQGSPVPIFGESRSVADSANGTAAPVEGAAQHPNALSNIQSISPAPVLSIRPEALTLGAPGSGHFDGRVKFVRDLGATVETFVDVGEHTLTAVCMPSAQPMLSVGDTVGIRFDADDAVVLAR